MPEHDQVPAAMRAQILARDNGCCRVCGRFVDTPGLHHVDYRSQGGLHLPENLITIGWTPGHDCHLPIVHANKRLWQPILRQVAITDGVNGLQLLRWYRTRGEPAPAMKLIS